jgi:hypothetical protein
MTDAAESFDGGAGFARASATLAPEPGHGDESSAPWPTASPKKGLSGETWFPPS